MANNRNNNLQDYTNLQNYMNNNLRNNVNHTQRLRLYGNRLTRLELNITNTNIPAFVILANTRTSALPNTTNNIILPTYNPNTTNQIGRRL